MTIVNELTSQALKDLLANKFTKNIGELDDVDTTTTPPVTNQVLTYDGTQWEPGNVPRSANDLSDVDTTGVTNGQVLVFDGVSAQFKPGSQAQALNDLIDVDTATVPPAEGQLLAYQSGVWKPKSNISYNAKDYGAKCDGVTDDYASLSNLINTTISGADATVLFPPGTCVIGTNLTIPSNIKIVFEKGAKLSPNIGVVLTINGPLQAGLYQIFTGGGTIAGNIKNPELFPQWWGAKADGVNDDAPAINSAVATSGGKGTIKFPLGTYFLNSKTASGFTAIDDCNIIVKNANGLKLIGESNEGVVFTTGNSANYTDILLIGNSKNIEVSNIKFVGNNAGLVAGNNNGAIAIYSCRWVYIHDCQTSVFQGSHFVGDWIFNTVFERCNFSVPSAASAFDVAFIQDFTIRDCDFVGGSASSQGFQHIYDIPNASSANNNTGQPLTNGISNNIRIEDSRFSNYQSGIVISDCTDVIVERNNIFSNYSSTGTSYWGILVQSTQASVPTSNIKILDNNIYQNGSGSGTAHSGAGIRIDPAGKAAINIELRGNSIFDNNSDGVSIANPNVTLHAKDNRFFNKNNTNQTTAIYGVAQLVTTPYPDKTSIVKDNEGYNPIGWNGLVNNPAIPVGVGSANAVTNNNPYPVMVYQNGGTGLHIISANGATDFAVVGGAQNLFILQPQDKVYFATVNTSGWNWYGM